MKGCRWGNCFRGAWRPSVLLAISASTAPFPLGRLVSRYLHALICLRSAGDHLRRSARACELNGLGPEFDAIEWAFAPDLHVGEVCSGRAVTTSGAAPTRKTRPSAELRDGDRATTMPAPGLQKRWQSWTAATQTHRATCEGRFRLRPRTAGRGRLYCVRSMRHQRGVPRVLGIGGSPIPAPARGAANPTPRRIEKIARRTGQPRSAPHGSGEAPSQLGTRLFRRLG
jgi:hypothetical protein